MGCRWAVRRSAGSRVSRRKVWEGSSGSFDPCKKVVESLRSRIPTWRLGTSRCPRLETLELSDSDEAGGEARLKAESRQVQAAEESSSSEVRRWAT